MKKLIFTVCALLVAFATAEAQTAAKKPTIMVVPDNQWCYERGFAIEFDDQGRIVKMPDYQAALDNDADLGLVISKLGELMTERGFNLKLLSASLRSLQAEATEDMMLQSKDSGAGAAETPIDKLKKVAKADIWMSVNWKVTTMGPRKTITYNLQGIDAYTDKQIAASSGSGMPSPNPETAALLIEAVNVHMDQFVSQLQSHFDNLFEQGREITVRCKRWDDCEIDFESEFDGEELGILIEDYIAANTVGGRFSTTDATENMMLFEQVRIPMVVTTPEGRERAVDARYFGRGLAKMITAISGGVPCKVMTKGLGQVTIVVGGK